MKKSKAIQLVLITAALASCNRVIIPGQSAEGTEPDPALTAATALEDSIYDCSCQLDPNNYNWYNPYDYYNIPFIEFNTYHTGQPYSVPYKAGHLYRINTTFRNHVLVVHGGFGKSASASSASSSAAS